MSLVVHFPMICDICDQNFSNNHLSTSVYTRQLRTVSKPLVKLHTVYCALKRMYTIKFQIQNRVVMDHSQVPNFVSQEGELLWLVSYSVTNIPVVRSHELNGGLWRAG